MDPQLSKVNAWYRGLLKDHGKLTLRYTQLHAHLRELVEEESDGLRRLAGDEWYDRAEQLLKRVIITGTSNEQEALQEPASAG